MFVGSHLVNGIHAISICAHFIYFKPNVLCICCYKTYLSNTVDHCDKNRNEMLTEKNKAPV